MKVLCINAKLNPDELPYDSFRLIEGNIYTVIGEQVAYNKFDFPVGVCYDLLEDGKYLWSKDKFIPLSTIDEKELAEQRLQIA